MELTILAMGISILIGISVGVLSAVYANSWLDSLITFVALAGVSIPSFWLGLILMLVFALGLGWFPPSGRPAPAFTAEGIRYIVLPAATLGIASAGILVRITRSQMLEILAKKTISVRRDPKGFAKRGWCFVMVCAARCLPVVTVLGIQFGSLLAGAVVAETVFAYPGVGRYLLASGIESRFSQLYNPARSLSRSPL